MALTPGVRLGPYEIHSAIGAGGMGEVWKARDTTLGRDVALKILPDHLALDPDRLARFKREAQILASLNHPNIAAIYGFQEADGVQALVLELVEGPTLADRIAQGPIPVDDALPIAKQIAEALEAAHEQGIIHRDLKPANVKLRPDGTVKVLDFGLAKALDTTGIVAPSGLSMSPTITSPAATMQGVILGTAAYMSPEQARGRTVDRRADVWAFGVVLFEMLTDRRAFEGDDLSITLAAVLKTEPDWSALPPSTPSTVRHLMARCLKKDPRDRLQAIGEARIALAGMRDDSAGSAAVVSAGAGASVPSDVPIWRRAFSWGLASVFFVGLAGLSAIHFGEARPDPPPEMRTEITTPPTADPLSFALSPDGRQLVFVAAGEGGPLLWIRSLSGTRAQPLPGTEGAATPFWSPDSRSIGFVAQGTLKRLDLDGSAPRPLANAIARGGAWNADGQILFARTGPSALSRIPASGGEPVPVTTLDGQTRGHWRPQFLPDGRHFLYHAQGTPDTAGIYLSSLDSGDRTRLTTADSGAAYASSGWLFWVRSGALVAQRLDLERQALSGELMTVADPVGFDNGTGAGGFSVSATGLLAYRAGVWARRQLEWVDRSGTLLETVGAPDEEFLSFPRVSPDGRRVLVFRAVQGNSDVWVLDGSRTSRLTFDPAQDRFALWSPKGDQIVFDSNRTGPRNLYLGSAGRPGGESLLLASPEDKAALDWSSDGRYLLGATPDPQSAWDIFVLPLFGDRQPWSFLKTKFNERAPAFSPDGRWVAYHSDESGRYEVYVRPFIDPGASQNSGQPGTSAGQQSQASTSGGIHAKWRADGKELYYLGPDGKMMAVSFTATSEAVEVGAPVELFQTRIFGGGTENSLGRQYDVGRNGHFLVNTVLDDTAGPITIVQNWTPQVK